MTSLEAMPARAGLTAANGAMGRWSVSVASSVEEASRAWLSLQVSGAATPYQTLGWQRAAFATLHADDRAAIVTLKDRAGRTMLLLPLAIRRKAGVAIASFPAGKHANYNMPLFNADGVAGIAAEELSGVLAEAARQAGIDLYALRNQPFEWTGQRNPLAMLPHQSAASSGWRAALSEDGEAYIAGLMSSESRKKLRHKERKLAELGPVTYAEAVTPDEARGVIAAFLRQKHERFATLGIDNPFSDDAVVRFLDCVAAQPLAAGAPAPVSLFAMMAGTRILAVFAGAVHAGRFSGMFTSFDPDPAVSRFSPGDLLLLNLVKTMCARGLSGFDLGVGDAAYKTNYCPIAEPLFDSILPMTLKGRAAALALATGLRAKTALKRHEALARPVRRLLRR
ncbi:MAG: GNAT family N-acetyltransferase [Beijerinckiaceae bacterium]